MFTPGSSSVSAFRSDTAVLLVIPICMSGVSRSISSSSSMSTVTLTISESLALTASWSMRFTSSLSPVSTLAFLLGFATAVWPAPCPSCWFLYHCFQSSSVQFAPSSSSLSLSGPPVMCSMMPVATHSPRASFWLLKIASALFATFRALFALPSRSRMSASMHMTDAMFRSSLPARKITIASSVALVALSILKFVISTCASVQSAAPVRLAFCCFLAISIASSAACSASVQPCSNVGVLCTMSPAWASSSRRNCEHRNKMDASASSSASSSASFRARSAARSAASGSWFEAWISAMMRSALASSVAVPMSWSTACDSRARATASAKSPCM
mmetsp:Transcript_80192/g.227047  ORF Transcript_80192/g.227047 Transcript_80192/m.227047 type:complete len:330 (+) Transcript_80192:185-1174(+)